MRKVLPFGRAAPVKTDPLCRESMLSRRKFPLIYPRDTVELATGHVSWISSSPDDTRRLVRLLVTAG
jgi:hypothetical protein